MQPNVIVPDYASEAKKIYSDAKLFPNLKNIIEEVKGLPVEKQTEALSRELNKFRAQLSEKSEAVSKLKSIAEISGGELTKNESDQLSFIEALISKEQKNSNNQIGIIAKAELEDLASLDEFYQSVYNSNLDGELKVALYDFVDKQKTTIGISEVKEEREAQIAANADAEKIDLNDVEKYSLSAVRLRSFNKDLVRGFANQFPENKREAVYEHYSNASFLNEKPKKLTELLQDIVSVGVKSGKLEEGLKTKVDNYFKEAEKEFTETKKLWKTVKNLEGVDSYEKGYTAKLLELAASPDDSQGEIDLEEIKAIKIIVEKLANVSGDYEVKMKNELSNFSNISGVPIDKVNNVFQGK